MSKHKRKRGTKVRYMILISNTEKKEKKEKKDNHILMMN